MRMTTSFPLSLLHLKNSSKSSINNRSRRSIGSNTSRTDQKNKTRSNRSHQSRHGNPLLLRSRPLLSRQQATNSNLQLLATTAFSLRGGSEDGTTILNYNTANIENNPPIDLDRVGLRLDSLGEYCVIASIILGAVIDIYGDRPEKPEHPMERFAYGIHGLCVCIGFVSAVYTTMVFSLFGLYAKTALGTGDDFGYLELLDATSSIRYRGFQSFLLCLFSFNMAFLVNLVLHHKGTTRWILCGIAGIGSIYSWTQFRFIIETARIVIFERWNTTKRSKTAGMQ